MAPPREQPLWIKIPLNLCGPIGVAMALLGYLNAGLGLLILGASTIYIGWELYPKADQFVRKSKVLSLISFVFAGMVMGFCAWLLVLKIHHPPLVPDPKKLPDLRLQIDKLIPLFGYTQLIGIPGQLIPIPKGREPGAADVDTQMIVIGTIINDRDVQATAAYWELFAKLSDGRSLNVALFSPNSDFLINSPTNPPTQIHVQDYWPRKLDMHSIPAKGLSYGYVLGVLKGVTPAEFNKPHTSVTLCFKDSGGQPICDTVRQEDKPSASMQHLAP